MGVAPDDPRLNPYGGAIACGHPLAATGVRLMAQLARGFRDRPEARYGLTALCVGLGMGAALLWENVTGVGSTEPATGVGSTVPVKSAGAGFAGAGARTGAEAAALPAP
jgi:acetyl-CoA acyltransferase